MKRFVMIAAIFAWSGAQAQMTYFLVDQWIEKGNRFCRYSDGTVLRVGASTCPLSIRG